MDNVFVECNACKKETEHAMAVHSAAADNKISVIARCLVCNTEIVLDLKEWNRGRSTADVLTRAAKLTAHMRKIIKGEPPQSH